MRVHLAARPGVLIGVAFHLAVDRGVLISVLIGAALYLAVRPGVLIGVAPVDSIATVQFCNEAVLLRLAVRPGVLHEYMVFAARLCVLDEVNVEITWRSLGAHLEATWRLHGHHLEATWRPLGDHLEATWSTSRPKRRPEGPPEYPS